MDLAAVLPSTKGGLVPSWWNSFFFFFKPQELGFFFSFFSALGLILVTHDFDLVLGLGLNFDTTGFDARAPTPARAHGIHTFGALGRHKRILTIWIGRKGLKGDRNHEPTFYIYWLRGVLEILENAPIPNDTTAFCV